MLFGLAAWAVAAFGGFVFLFYTLRRLAVLANGIEELRRRVAALEAWRPADVAAPLEAPARLEPVLPIASAAPETPSVTPEAVAQPSRDREKQSDGDTLERLIGGQWLLYIGVLVVLVGIAYFEKLAFESTWMSATARVLQGALAGGVLVYLGTRFARASYTRYGHVISGAGVAVLYLSAYASFNYYHLIGRPTAFVLMTLITLGGVVLAERQQSQGLALFAVGGGFLTPFLLPGTSDAQIALFGYDAILIAGSAALARGRAWTLLSTAAYVLTVVTVAAWADRFYAPDKYLRTEVFLTAFCAMFVFMIGQARSARALRDQVARMFLLTAPFAYYAASLVILFDHPAALLVWLVSLTAIGAAASARRGQGWGLAVWAAAAAPLLAWSTHQPRAWLWPGLGAIAGVYAVALAAQMQAADAADRESVWGLTWVHANGLGMFAAAYFLIEPFHVAVTSSMALVFALWQFAVAGTTRRTRELQAAHFTALGLALVAIAIALQFDGPAVTTGWAAEGFAIVVLGFRQHRAWLRFAGIALLGIAFWRAEWMLLAPPVMGQAVLFNTRAACAVFLVAVTYATAWLHLQHPGDATARKLAAGAILAAQVLSLTFLTSEIDAYWEQRQRMLAREVMRSVTWAAYATALILVGLRRNYAPIRLFAIGVLAITVAKVFAVDLSHLDRVYRIVSIIGVGLMLLAASYLYQRTRAGTPIGSSPPRGNESGPSSSEGR